MTTARFNMIAARMQPQMECVSIEETPSSTFLTLSCGHIRDFAPHFSYKVGEKYPCYDCGKVRAALLDEFKDGNRR